MLIDMEDKIKLKCPVEDCLVSCMSMRSARQHALVQHQVNVDYAKGSNVLLVQRAATADQLKRAKEWNRSKSYDNRPKEVDKENPKKVVRKAVKERSEDSESDAGPSSSASSSGVGWDAERARCHRILAKDAERAKEKDKEDPKKKNARKEEPEKESTKKKDQVQEKKELLKKAEQELDEVSQRIIEFCRQKPKETAGVPSMDKQGTPHALISPRPLESQSVVFSSAGEPKSSLQLERERAARRRRQEAQSHAAASVAMSVGGVREEGPAFEGYVPTPISVLTAAAVSRPTGDFFPTEASSDEEGLTIDTSVVPEEFIAAAAAAAGIVVQGGALETQPIPPTQPPGNQTVLGLPPSQVSSTTDLLRDDQSWSSEMDLEMEPEHESQPFQKEATVVPAYVEFSQEDEVNLIALATKQAPAWRLGKNCSKWMAFFPGRDPEVLRRRYALILRSWSAFQTVNDLMLGKDGRSVPGHTVSATMQQGLAQFNAQGRYE